MIIKFDLTNVSEEKLSKIESIIENLLFLIPVLCVLIVIVSATIKTF